MEGLSEIMAAFFNDSFIADYKDEICDVVNGLKPHLETLSPSFDQLKFASKSMCDDDRSS